MIHFLSKAKQRALQDTALLRLDFNTKDDWRMKAVLPTIKFLLKNSQKIVVISHRGRPKGFEKALSLKKDATDLSKLIKRKVIFIDHFRFKEIKKIIADSPRGSVFLLQNLRFMKEEEKNDEQFARNLASLADFYVNDAFAVSHRANASVVAVTRYLPHYAGLELEKEIASLSKVMARPAHPLVVVIGGAKAADKLGVMAHFQKKADWFLLGGGPANTILTLRGVDVRRSIRDTDAKDLRSLAHFTHAKNVVVPQDYAWHQNMIWDIGPKTEMMFTRKISAARTLLWSGPLGLIEKRPFAKGSLAVARAVAKNKKLFSVTGGGETVMFLKKYGLDKKFSFISTGGTAMLDYLAGEKLPGIEALK